MGCCDAKRTHRGDDSYPGKIVNARSTKASGVVVMVPWKQLLV